MGALLGDHPGVHFLAKNPFEMYMDTTGAADLVWEIVASDLILGKVFIQNEWKRFCAAFRSNATVVGICPAGRLRLVFDSGERDPGVSLTTAETEEGDWFCMSLEGDTDCDPRRIGETVEKRAAFFDAFRSANLKENVGKAWLHAVSVMKSQVCTPEGPFRHLWTTPERYPHKKLWLWDSAFHSLGNRVLGEGLAMDTILSVLDTQLPDGMIPLLLSQLRTY